MISSLLRSVKLWYKENDGEPLLLYKIVKNDELNPILINEDKVTRMKFDDRCNTQEHDSDEDTWVVKKTKKSRLKRVTTKRKFKGESIQVKVNNQYEVLPVEEILLSEDVEEEFNTEEKYIIPMINVKNDKKMMMDFTFELTDLTMKETMRCYDKDENFKILENGPMILKDIKIDNNPYNTWIGHGVVDLMYCSTPIQVIDHASEQCKNDVINGFAGLLSRMRNMVEKLIERNHRLDAEITRMIEIMDGTKPNKMITSRVESEYDDID